MFSVRLDWAFYPIHMFNGFLVGFMGTVHVPPNSTKHRFLSKFGSHGTIHNFKNYFATVFSAISFQFSANKRYPNTPLSYSFYKIKKEQLLMFNIRLDWAFYPIYVFSIFLVGFMGTIHVSPNSAKYRFLSKFGSHSTIHTFKNYFTTVFSAISF